MNPRLKEIMYQTGVPVSMPFDEWCEKFAALIIEECIINLDFHGHDEAASQLVYLKTNRFGIK